MGLPRGNAIYLQVRKRAPFLLTASELIFPVTTCIAAQGAGFAESAFVRRNHETLKHNWKDYAMRLQTLLNELDNANNTQSIYIICFLRQVVAKALLHDNAEFSWQKSMWCFITNVHYLKQTPLLIIRRYYYFRPKQMKFESCCLTTKSLLLCNIALKHETLENYLAPPKFIQRAAAEQLNVVLENWTNNSSWIWKN